MVYEFDSTLWEWTPGQSDSWIFLSLPEDVSDEILDMAGPYARGFGSLRVEAAIGGTVWRTSIFPSSAHKSYSLPVKRAVRTAEGLALGRPAHVRLRLVDVEAPTRPR
jgi:hypothetical protein